MHHLNGHLLCAIDVETTGLNPFEDEIIEVAVVPVDSLIEIHPDITPFDMLMIPTDMERVSNATWKVTGIKFDDVMAHGMEPYAAADLFVQWFRAIGLPEGKRISPLAHNWCFDNIFIRRWLGNETYELIFDGRYRDTMCNGLWQNDRADHKSAEYPFPKVNLPYMAKQYHIDTSGGHRALFDCVTTIQLYNKLVKLPKYVG